MANKARRLVSLSQEVDEKLDGINASALIEELLEGHFNYITSSDLELLEKKRDEIQERLTLDQQRLDHINMRINKVHEQSAQNVDREKNARRLMLYIRFLKEQIHRDINLTTEEVLEESRKISEKTLSVPENWDEQELYDLKNQPNPRKEAYLKKKQEEEQNAQN
jgi:hypothetical protein